MSVPRPEIEIAHRLSVTRCTDDRCNCGQITLRFHNEDGETFAAFQMDAQCEQVFLERFTEMANKAGRAAGPPGLAAIRCEGVA